MKSSLLFFLFLLATAVFSQDYYNDWEEEARSVRHRRDQWYRVVECDPPCQTGGHVPTCCKVHRYRGGGCWSGAAWCHK